MLRNTLRIGVIVTTKSRPLDEASSPYVEKPSKNISLGSVGPDMVAKSNVLIFLIALGDCLPGKPWFVGVNRRASRRSIARSIIFALNKKVFV